MKNNTQVETAQKSQATNKIQPKNVQKDLAKIDEIRKNKSKVPTGKVTLLKEIEARKKAREEQFCNFRINALKRRCKRMGFDEAKTNKYIEKLKKQMDEPKQYTILVTFDNADFGLLKEAIVKANINYNILVAGNSKARVSYGYMSLVGDQAVLAKIREIAPPSAKIHPYAKKMESVIPKEEMKVIKKPSNNTAETKKNAKAVRKEINKKRGMHKKGSSKFLAKKRRNLSLAQRIAKHKATAIQLKAKKSSTGSKKASTNLKKAA